MMGTKKAQEDNACMSIQEAKRDAICSFFVDQRKSEPACAT